MDKRSAGLGVVALTYNSSVCELRQKDHREFQASLGYIAEDNFEKGGGVNLEEEKEEKERRRKSEKRG